MLATDPKIKPIVKRAIERLLKKRSHLQEQVDALASTPASYSIVGSVSVTNQKVSDLKDELAEIDLQIKQMLTGGASGMSLSYPDYRWRPLP